MTEIIPGLFIGTVDDARTFQGKVICVLNQWPWDGHPNALWIPIVVADADNLAKPIQALPGNLAIIAHEIIAARKDGIPVLVHCREGIERSPLAVAWYLRLGRGDSLDAAYKLLREKRPEVVDRRSWLP